MTHIMDVYVIDGWDRPASELRRPRDHGGGVVVDSGTNGLCETALSLVRAVVDGPDASASYDRQTAAAAAPAKAVTVAHGDHSRRSRRYK